MDRNNCFRLELESAFSGCVKANSKMSTTVRESTNEGDCKNEPGKQKKVSYILQTYCLLSLIQGKRTIRTEKTSHFKNTVDAEGNKMNETDQKAARKEDSTVFELLIEIRPSLSLSNYM